MSPEEYFRRYGRYPSKALMDAWASGPQARNAPSPFVGKPIRELAYDALMGSGLTLGSGEKGRQVRGQLDRELEGEGLTKSDLGLPVDLSWTNPASLLAGGIGSVVEKSVHPEKSPSALDWGTAGLETLGLGAPKLFGMAIHNAKNYVRGGYSGGGSGLNPLAAVLNMASLPADVAKQLLSTAASARALRGLSNVTYGTVKRNLQSYDDLGKQWANASGEARQTIAKKRRDMARQIAGQLNQNVLHNAMMGKPQKALGPWFNRHFKKAMNFERQNAGQMFDDVDADLIFDMSHKAWGGLRGLGEGMQGRGVVYLEKAGSKEGVAGARKITGDSHRDIFTSRQHRTLSKLSAHHAKKGSPLRTREDYINALDDWDPNWRKMIALSDDNIVDGTNGVLFQFSPAGRTDYLLGGFNAIMKYGDDGSAKFFGTDKQDMLGFGIPGHSDGVVGIGTTSRQIRPRTTKKNGKVVESTGKPTRYKKPPKQKAEERVRTVKRKKDGAPEYISKEDRKLLIDLLGVSTNPRWPQLARRALAIGTPLGLLSMD
jgi:hypothetical protein